MRKKKLKGGSLGRFLLGLWAVFVAAACSNTDKAEKLGAVSERVWAASWTDLSGYGTGVSLSVGNGGRLHVWTTHGTGNSVRRKTYNPPTWDGVWSSGGAPANGVSGVPAAVLLSNGRTAVVVKDNNNNLWWRTYDDRTQTWPTDWAQVGATAGAALGSPAVSAINGGPDGPGGFYVWARGLDNRLWMTSYGLSSGWTNWLNTGGAPPSNMTGSPAATSRSISGAPWFSHEVVVRDASGQPWHRTYTGNTWSNAPGQSTGWEPLTGNTASSPAASNYGSQLDVWARGISTDNTLYHNVQTGSTWSGWASLAGPVGGMSTAADAPVVASVYRGLGYANGLDLVVQSSGTAIYYTNWYQSGPADAPLNADKTVNLPTWENNPLVVPPGKAGCSDGAVFFSVGDAARIWRGSLSTFTTSGAGAVSADVTCGANGTTSCDINYGTPPWPALNTGFIEAPGESNDQRLVRVGSRLVFMKQGVRRESDNTQPRGVEYVFQSLNCGATWILTSVLDPKSMFNGAYHDPASKTGFDFPVLYLDPFTPHRIYLTLSAGEGAGGKSGKIFGYSDDYGSTWSWPSLSDGKYAEKSGLSYLTSLPSGKVYIYGPYGQGTALIAYDSLANKLSSTQTIGDGQFASLAGYLTNSAGIVRVGSFSDGDYVRVFYPTGYLNGIALQSLMLRIDSFNFVTAFDSLLEVPGNDTSGRQMSVMGLGLVESDRLDWRANDQRNPAIAVWYETSATPTTAGQVNVRYRLYYDNSWGSSVALPPGGFTRLPDDVGHFLNGGSFWFDSGLNRLRYLATWPQFTSTGREDMEHTDVVDVTP